MALFYRYYFLHPEDLEQAVCIYAKSEKVARRMFKEWYGVDPGVLIDRSGW